MKRKKWKTVFAANILQNRFFFPSRCYYVVSHAILFLTGPPTSLSPVPWDPTSRDSFLLAVKCTHDENRRWIWNELCFAYRGTLIGPRRVRSRSPFVPLMLFFTVISHTRDNRRRSREPTAPRFLAKFQRIRSSVFCSRRKTYWH